MGENSSLTLGSDIEVNSLQAPALLDLSALAGLNNLPDVGGDFSVLNGATLVLRENTLFKTIGSFTNAGLVSLFDATWSA